MGKNGEGVQKSFGWIILAQMMCQLMNAMNIILFHWLAINEYKYLEDVYLVKYSITHSIKFNNIFILQRVVCSDRDKYISQHSARCYDYLGVWVMLFVFWLILSARLT